MQVGTVQRLVQRIHLGLQRGPLAGIRYSLQMRPPAGDDPQHVGTPCGRIRVRRHLAAGLHDLVEAGLRVGGGKRLLDAIQGDCLLRPQQGGAGVHDQPVRLGERGERHVALQNLGGMIERTEHFAAIGFWDVIHRHAVTDARIVRNHPEFVGIEAEHQRQAVIQRAGRAPQPLPHRDGGRRRFGGTPGVRGELHAHHLRRHLRREHVQRHGEEAMRETR